MASKDLEFGVTAVPAPQCLGMLRLEFWGCNMSFVMESVTFPAIFLVGP